MLSHCLVCSDCRIMKPVGQKQTFERQRPSNQYQNTVTHVDCILPTIHYVARASHQPGLPAGSSPGIMSPDETSTACVLMAFQRGLSRHDTTHKYGRRFSLALASRRRYGCRGCPPFTPTMLDFSLCPALSPYSERCEHETPDRRYFF